MLFLSLLILMAVAGLTIAGVVALCAKNSCPPPTRNASPPAYRPSAASAPQYEKGRPLFSPAERSFFMVLDQAVGTDMRIMAKVRLADLVQPSSRLPAAQKTAAFNRISRKHVDYVLCDPLTLAALAVVELDDRSHQRADRRERDAFVDGALAEAGIPIFHVPCRGSYDVNAIRGMVHHVVPSLKQAA